MSQDQVIRLTTTSYVVLGMLDWLGPSTSYRLKRVLAESVEDFFPVPHTSFYAEPARLARGRYLRERQERGGRRRRTYELTDRGRAALGAWLADPSADYGEFRFPGMLKLFFGADPDGFAADQAAHHRELAEKFKAVREVARKSRIPMPPRRRLVLDTGIRVHEWWTQTWERVAEEDRRSGGKGS
jgi:PadR family transcriptional regulator, regulatory protein AphA